MGGGDFARPGGFIVRMVLFCVSDERLRQELLHKSNNSLGSGSSQSNSPPDSPYGSQYLEQGRTRVTWCLGAEKPTAGLLASINMA